jgi:hypothetical protein
MARFANSTAAGRVKEFVYSKQLYDLAGTHRMVVAICAPPDATYNAQQISQHNRGPRSVASAGRCIQLGNLVALSR